MDYFKSVSIIVNIPVYLDEEALALYDSLSKSGYNLFDANDSFYTDICTTYTSENGTDVILKDRQNEIYSSNANISLCQSSCTFESYNITTKKAKCNCDIQNITTETNINNIKFGSNLLVNSFLITFKYSNIIVLKCFKLAIDLTSLSKNIGRIIMIIIFFLFLICIFIFLFKDKKNIENFINLILHYMRNIKKNSFIGKEKNKMKNNGNLENKKRKNQKSKDKKENNIKKKPIRKKISKKGKRNEPPKRKIYKNKKQLKAKKDDNKRMINSKNELLNKSKRNYKGININIIPIKNIIKYKIKKNNKKTNRNETQKINIYKEPKNNLFNRNDDIFYTNLNDQELNTLTYENALKYDKRTYCEYYKALLRKKQLLLFAFFPLNDYNLLSVKISLFLLSFSLYFTINALFYTDDTMHNIYMDNGEYNLSYQIPHLLYSTLISSLINFILRFLSLTEQNFLSLKKERNLKEAIKKGNSVKTCISIKLTSFFILSTILLLFFCYFISCFCGVYSNTQTILIKDIVISF